ncbi:methyltransferase domain-containing protein [Kutzneria sp. NPDC052558]|uniref:methyltransferase domain-containing protein n=1 Tax=Kutzneria sp. NPDC052558 TaxID=3364121 RepID=UPI0037CA61ED
MVTAYDTAGSLGADNGQTRGQNRSGRSPASAQAAGEPEARRGQTGSKARQVRQQHDLVAALRSAGKVPSAWAAAFAAVDRGAFVPDRMWCDDEHGRLRPVDRRTAPEQWAAAVYSDIPIATQLDDGRVDWPDTSPLVTSSASQPSVVLAMLDALDVHHGDTALEIGTGTGYNAALLAHRIGCEQVTTVELDPALADQARSSLAKAGATPNVVHADGTGGYPEHAPYDRVIATAAVLIGHVPYAWVAQTRHGGRIVTPAGTAFRNGELMALTVHHGTATGRIVDDAAFMRLRDQRTPLGAARLSTLVDESPATTESVTAISPGDLVFDDDCAFAVGLLLPDVQSSVWWDDEQPGRFEVLLFDVASDSAATAVAETSRHDDRYQVRQYGPRRLWDEAEAARAWWVGHGRPGRRRFGLTVTAEHQKVWLDDTTNTVGGPT